jgi:hypothetical protein
MSDVSNSKYVGKWSAVSVGAFSDSGDLSVENVLSLNADGPDKLKTTIMFL